MIESKPLQTILRDEHQSALTKYKSIPVFKNPRQVDNIPTDFDGKKVWKDLLSPIKNQGECGSCWAFASTSTLADRFNIQSSTMINKALHIDLSPTKLVLCDFQGEELNINHPEQGSDRVSLAGINRNSILGYACVGNTLYDAFRYLYEIGTNEDSCINYNKLSTISNDMKSLTTVKNPVYIPTCDFISGPIGDMCNGFSIDYETGTEFGTPARFYKTIGFYTIPNNVHSIQNDIYLYGPVASAIIVYADFYTYDSKTSVYEWDKKSPRVGGHSIEIVGWGSLVSHIDNTLKAYWLVKNSWGDNWGIDGYFMIARGVNECGIEENCIGCFPDYFYSVDYKFPLKGFPSMPTSLVDTRLNLATNLSVTGGGIDLTVGYTRRVLNTMQWLDFSPPINNQNIPDINSFVAGDISTRVYGTTLQSLGSPSKWVFIIFVVFLFILFTRLCIRKPR